MKTLMLMADNAHTAEAIADQVGNDDAQDSLLPPEKTQRDRNPDQAPRHCGDGRRRHQ
ncbi:hypothetical protein [Metapseudomonas furukawaii]|uniref:hypothetical protein n=1 Tax=Metapseudomonas furukawaii TaxID=1149133 RepID=UPI00178C2957